MMDTLTRNQRSERMRRIKSRDTRPELQLRRLVWALGHRYRKNQRAVRSKPDIAFVSRKRAMFLHGCFWHRHDCPLGRRTPKSRVGFWSKKFNDNVQRDARVMRELRTEGWTALVVWECELHDQGKVERRLRRFLDA
jgi:DNA mismatch endonuclease (patch repair protein)